MDRFEWLVPANGYWWVDGVSEAGIPDRFLTDGTRSGGWVDRGSSIQPLRFRDRRGDALFQVFSEVPRTEEGIAAFANRFGWMGAPERVVRPDGESLRGESFTTWKREAGDLWNTILLWELVMAKDVETLAGVVRWSSDGRGVECVSRFMGIHVVCGSIPTEGGGVRIEAPAEWSEPIDRFRRGDILGPAAALVRYAVNRKIEDNMRVRLMLGSQDGEVEWMRFPTNLLGALWLQFGEFIEQKLQSRRCPVCSQPFVLNSAAKGRGRRSDINDTTAAREWAVYCGDPCRAKAARERKKTALELSGRGMSVDRIAGAVGSDVAAVQGWLDEAATKASMPKRPRGRPPKQP